jgi:hypothetical protein
MVAAVIGRCQQKFLCILLVGFFAACAPYGKDDANRLGKEPPSSTIRNAESDGLLLIFVREFSFDPKVDDIRDEKTFVTCVRDAILEERPHQKLVSFDDFHQTVFPHLTRRSVPRDPEYIAALRDSTEFRRGTASLSLGHMAFIGGVVKVEQSGGGACVGGYGGAGCFGYWEWEKASHAGASILTLEGANTPESIESSATGTAWLAMVGEIPLGLPSQPTDVACQSLGKDILQYLAGLEQ